MNDKRDEGFGDGANSWEGTGSDVSPDVEAEVEHGQSLINEAKEMARRDWENQYDGVSSESNLETGAPEVQPTDPEAGAEGAFDDALDDVDSSLSGDRTDVSGSIGDPTSDVDSAIHNRQAGLGGAIGVLNDALGGTAGDDQITTGGAFNDARGGVGSASFSSSDVSDAGLVTNDLQGAVDMSPAGDETRIDGSLDNVETTLTGGFVDEQAASASKFDSVRSEVERNFSDVSGTADSEDASDTAAEEFVAADAGDFRFGDSGVAGEADATAGNVNSRADGLGVRAREAGEDLKHRAAEAREQAAHRLEDVRRELGQSEGKSVVEDVQAKAKGILNKVKDAFDSSKKS